MPCYPSAGDFDAMDRFTNFLFCRIEWLYRRRWHCSDTASLWPVSEYASPWPWRSNQLCRGLLIAARPKDKKLGKRTNAILDVVAQSVSLRLLLMAADGLHTAWLGSYAYV